MYRGFVGRHYSDLTPDETHLGELARALLLQQVCDEVPRRVADGG